MESKKVAVTGANGYIGRHVTSKLLELGHEVIAVDINRKNISSEIHFVEKSVLDADENIFENLGKPDICIHLAWRDGFQHNSNVHMGDLSKHYYFVRHMLEGGLRNINIMGSMHEVGYWEGVIDENTPTNPLSMYGIAKNSLRQAAKLLAKEFNADLKWLRGFYVLGDDSSNHSVFTKLLEKEKAGEETFPFTSGKNQYDFLDVKDLAEQIVFAALQDEITGEINCCSGQPVSLGDRVERFIKENQLNIRLEYGAFPDRPYDSPAVWGDTSKIKEIMSKVYK